MISSFFGGRLKSEVAKERPASVAHLNPVSFKPSSKSIVGLRPMSVWHSATIRPMDFFSNWKL